MSNAATYLSKDEIENIFPELAQRYELLGDEPIGRPSGFGAVWRARDTWIKEIVAIKISDSDLSTEVKMCRDIAGQTVRVYEYFKNGDWNAYSMELLESPWKTIEDVDKERRRKKDRLQHYLDCFVIARSILDALSEIHGLPYSRKGGHVHADIQPRNIFVSWQKKTGTSVISKLADERDFIKIIDLGLTVKKGEYRIGRHAAYAHPSVAKALPGSDLYSLAIVMLELMTGERPSHEQMKNRARIWKHVTKFSSGSRYLDATALDFANKLARAAMNKSITAQKAINFLDDEIFKLSPELIPSIKVIHKMTGKCHSKNELANVLFPVFAKINKWKNRSEDRERHIRSRIADMVEFDILMLEGHSYSLNFGL